jgi:hypothetical protein
MMTGVSFFDLDPEPEPVMPTFDDPPHERTRAA